MRKRILIVENSFLIGLDLADFCDSVGYSAMGPHMSVASARRSVAATRPDVAVMDVHLKRETTLAFGAELSARGIPVLYVSADKDSAQRLRASGAAFLEKPFSHATLARAVQEILTHTEPTAA